MGMRLREAQQFQSLRISPRRAIRAIAPALNAEPTADRGTEPAGGSLPQRIAYGATLLFAYGLGVGLPILVLGTAAGSLAARLDKLGWRVWVERGAGAALSICSGRPGCLGRRR
jgi:hypothetical protein